MSSKFELIECDGCLLRPHLEGDKKHVIDVGYDEGLFLSIGSPVPDISIEEYADLWFDLKTDPKYSWAIEVDGICVGSVWIHSIEEVNRRARFAIEIHHPDYRNHGIGRKATKAVIRFVFEVLKLHRLDLRVLTSNRNAINCYKACGFREEGVQRDTLFLNDEWFSDLWMSILEDEYSERANNSCHTTSYKAL